MHQSSLTFQTLKNEQWIVFEGSLSLYDITNYQEQLKHQKIPSHANVILDLRKVKYIDTAFAIFINSFSKNYKKFQLICEDPTIQKTLQLCAKQFSKQESTQQSVSFINELGKTTYKYLQGFMGFIHFLGILFTTKLYAMKSLQNLRIKEIAFEINESAIKAIGIIALTSFLIGLVVAYQSAYQLKIYGANIFIVDMLGLSILRELSPLITAIVIAGRSGSAYAAQIGAMKITQELDAMRTMGFDPYIFLVLPRIIALMITMPLLIFLSDVMAMFGGMLIAHIDLHITSELFIDRFNEVIAAKHFFVGIVKGPFFAFLIASIGIYRGLQVKDDTQSIGFNTTKSVVEAIFAVIVCDALFSIAFTNLGI